MPRIPTIPALAGALFASLFAACLGGGEKTTGPIDSKADSIHVLLPSETYSVAKTPVYACDTLPDSSITCTRVERYEYSIDLFLDSVEIPRSAKTFRGSEDAEWWVDQYVGPCEIGLIGTLKARVSGSGSSATYLSVPAAVDTAIIASGGWRRDETVLWNFLEDVAPARAKGFENLEWVEYRQAVAALPDSFLLTGRKPTRAQTLAFVRDRVLNHCERYHARDTAWLPTNVSPCGGDYPPCNYGVPICSSDSLKAARADGYEWQLGPDQLRILVDTTALVGPNMSVTGAIEISCPVR